MRHESGARRHPLPGGKATVELGGARRDTFDLYSDAGGPKGNEPLWYVLGLDEGTHDLTRTRRAVPSSDGSKVWIENLVDFR